MTDKLLKRTLRRFRLTRGRDSSVTSSKTKYSETTEPLQPDSAFLNLPLDIFNLLIRYLTYRDLVALSLTTKGLRHLCPDVLSKDAPGLACISLIHKRLLPNRTSPSKLDPTFWGECSYCSHPLCSPTCPSALFLDYRTGIFFPASLYPNHEAIASKTRGFAETSGCHERFLPGDTSTPWDNSPTDGFDKSMYKTVWCEHHRCPASLMKDNYIKENAPMGAYRFYGDYYSRGGWAPARDGPPRSRRDSPFTIPHTKFLVGYREKPTIENEEPVDDQSTTVEQMENVVKFYRLNLNNGIDPSFDPKRDQDPIDEKYFYDTLCRHCFLPLRRSDAPGIFWSRRICTCAGSFHSRVGAQSRNPILVKPGCPGCGVVSVKFTVVEAFAPVPAYDSLIRFSLVLASEMQITTVGTLDSTVLNSPRAEATTARTARRARKIERLTPLRPEKVKQALDIIRYEPLIPIPPKPARGLQDLPLPIINKILFYVLCNTRYWKTRYIPEARRLIFQGRGDWHWDNYYNEPTGTCSECRRFKNLDRDIRIRSTWRCTDDCNYGFHMFMTKGGIRIY
ncbi:hypothetical protein TWF281_010458 [Arthrobotrys megalospora]